jgi:hypothetical protein
MAERRPFIRHSTAACLSGKPADPESGPAACRSPGITVRAVLATAAALMTLGQLVSAPATALSCMRIPEEQSLSLLEEATLVFDGEVVSVLEQPNGTLATARIRQLYKGDTLGDVVSFSTSLPVRAPNTPWTGLEIGEGDRGLVVLNESDGGLVQTNLPCMIPWAEHLERLQDERME